jgi:hypothetical protein
MITDYTEKQKEKQKSGIIAAFYSAYFSRLKTLSGSDLENVINAIDRPVKQAMTDEEMLAAVRRMAASFGGE